MPGSANPTDRIGSRPRTGGGRRPSAGQRGERVALESAIGAFEMNQQLPENPALRRAISKLAKRGSRENLARLYEHLLRGPVLIAIAELPSCTGHGGPDALATGLSLPVRFETARGPGGETSLAVFTDAAAVAARNPSHVWLAIEPRALLRWVAGERLGGLLLNPQGLSAFVPRPDVLELAGLRAGRRTRPDVGDAEMSIRRALDSLYDATNPHVFLVLEERTTRKSVQFARALDGSVTLDVSTAKMTRDEVHRAKQMFDGISGYVEEPSAFGGPAFGGPDESPAGVYKGPEIARFKAILSGDPAQAAQSAMQLFTRVYRFPAGFELGIEMR